MDVFTVLLPTVVWSMKLLTFCEILLAMWSLAFTIHDQIVYMTFVVSWSLGLRIFVETWFSLTVCAILFSMLTTEWGWPTDYTIFVATCGMTVYTIFLILLDNVVIIVDTLQNPPAPIPETRSVKGPFDPLNFRLVTGLFDHLNHLNANVAPSHLTDLTPAAVESLVSLKN
jgi:hypothetical protein